MISYSLISGIGWSHQHTCGFCQEITETDTLLSIGAQGTVLSWAAVFFVMSVMGWFGDVVYPLVNIQKTMENHQF